MSSDMAAISAKSPDTVASVSKLSPLRVFLRGRRLLELEIVRATEAGTLFERALGQDHIASGAIESFLHLWAAGKQSAETVLRSCMLQNGLCGASALVFASSFLLLNSNDGDNGQ